MNYCSNCGHALQPGAKFCPACGAQLAEQAGPQSPATGEENVNRVKGLYGNATAKLNQFTGESGEVKVSLSDLFSEVFKHHTKGEAENIFIAGTETTTPALSDVSDDWAKPWVFSRVLAGFLIAFAGLLYLFAEFRNENAIPGLIMVGALAVPFSGLIFFFESNAFQDVSIFETVKIFFIGGVFSLIVTLVLYEFVSFSETSKITGLLTLQDGLAIGVVEELGKVLIICYFVNQLKVEHVLDGLLIGAAVGAGFASFETAGYIYRAGGYLIEVAVVRGWSAIGGHLVWAAITGGALMVVKRKAPFKFSQLLDTRFLVFFALVVIMHAVWDWDVTILGSDNLKIIALIIVAWIVVFVLMNAGLKEIGHLKQDHPAE